MNEPDLPEVLARCWALLDRHLAAPPARVSLATVDGAGRPQVRMVALRRATRETASMQVFTDALSCKMIALQGDPNVTLLLWRSEEQVQLRLSGDAAIRTGADVADLWQAMRPEQRNNYAHHPPPGTPIPSPASYSIAPDPARFAVLDITLRHIDFVSLAAPRHMRAEFSAEDNWQGRWLSP